DPSAFSGARSGLDVVAHLALRRALDPFGTMPIGSDDNLVRERRNLRVELRAEAPGKHRVVDHEPHFRVEMRRALIEVERTDEDPLTIDGEGLRVQLAA